MRLRREETYRSLDLEEDRLRQRFLTNIKELRESQELYAKMDTEAIKA